MAPHPMAPTRGRCLVCGSALGDEPHWITDHPHGAHEACRDWERTPFPFDRDLKELRRIAQVLTRGYRLTVRLGSWLAELERRWPPVQAGEKPAGRAVTEFRRRRGEFQSQLLGIKKRLKL